MMVPLYKSQEQTHPHIIAEIILLLIDRFIRFCIINNKLKMIKLYITVSVIAPKQSVKKESVVTEGNPATAENCRVKNSKPGVPPNKTGKN